MIHKYKYKYCVSDFYVADTSYVCVRACVRSESSWHMIRVCVCLRACVSSASSWQMIRARVCVRLLAWVHVFSKYFYVADTWYVCVRACVRACVVQVFLRSWQMIRVCVRAYISVTLPPPNQPSARRHFGCFWPCCWGWDVCSLGVCLQTFERIVLPAS